MFHVLMLIVDYLRINFRLFDICVLNICWLAYSRKLNSVVFIVIYLVFIVSLKMTYDKYFFYQPNHPNLIYVVILLGWRCLNNKCKVLLWERERVDIIRGDVNVIIKEEWGRLGAARNSGVVRRSSFYCRGGGRLYCPTPDQTYFMGLVLYTCPITTGGAFISYPSYYFLSFS